MTKRNILMISVFLGLMVLLGIGVSYSMWNMSNIEDTENVISTTDCFDISITSQENSISLKNSYPISDEKGKKLTPFTFKVTNKCETAAKYSINLESLNGSTLSSEFLDVMLNNGEIKRLNSYSSADKVNSSSVESRELEIGILGNKESRDYSLRLWIDYDTTMEDLNNETKVLKSKIVIIGKPINYTGKTVFNFDYTGSEQVFTVPVSGTYKLETWCAQGGDNIGLVEDLGNIYDTENQNEGGTGGYSVGIISKKFEDKLFINVGGKGTSAKSRKNNENYLTTIAIGGYNGGGDTNVCDADGDWYAGSGGGATHISTKSGLLFNLENSKSDIIIVSGGGGGNFFYMNTTRWKHYSFGGNAGGFNGQDTYHLYSSTFPMTVSGKGGKQMASEYNSSDIKDGTFGKGATYKSTDYKACSSGGGGGYYGGSSTFARGLGGGFGYIGNHLLKDKVMYCYNCEESSDESTKTISTTCSEETPTSYCAKKGNGYARITLVSIDE